MEVDSKEVSVTFLGFVGDKRKNTGNDKGYLIDTDKDLIRRYSIKAKGLEYPIIIKYDDMEIGKVFVKLL